MTKFQRAIQIWVLLACAAHEKRMYTYGGLGQRLGMKRAGSNMATVLGPVMHYCEYHELPPLTILVVNQETGVPGDALAAAVDINPAERKRVFGYNWLDMPPPTVEALKRACNAD